MKETVIVIAYETSYLENKIKSLGYNVFPINYFSKKNLWKNLNITNLKKIRRDLKNSSNKISMIYGSGLENRPEIYSYLEKNFINKGNKLNLLYKCGYIYNFRKEITDIGLNIPKLFKNNVNTNKSKCIYKPKNSCGGYDIRYSNPNNSRYYTQEYIPGDTFSISFFIHNNQQFKFLGFNKQYFLKQYDIHPFVHAGAGNLRNIKFSRKIQSSIKMLAYKLDLIGFNSIDFKIYNNMIFILDINPRITSTFKIYNDFYKNKLLKYQLLSNTNFHLEDKLNKNYGFIHIFPKKEIYYDGMGEVILKDIINKPKSGEYISHGDPLFTIFTHDKNYKKLKEKLRKKLIKTKEIYSCYDIII